MDNNQDIVARLSALEATLKVSLDGLKASIERIENTLKEDKTASEIRVEKLETRISRLEQWRTAFVATGSAIVMIWTLFGNAIQNSLGIVN